MTTAFSRPLGPHSENSLNATLVAEMATVLRTHHTDLDDEACVLVALQHARFRPGDIVALADAAVAEARRAANAEAEPSWAIDDTWGGR
jgi:hypothetical protein